MHILSLARHSLSQRLHAIGVVFIFALHQLQRGLHVFQLAVDRCNRLLISGLTVNSQPRGNCAYSQCIFLQSKSAPFGALTGIILFLNLQVYKFYLLT